MNKARMRLNGTLRYFCILMSMLVVSTICAASAAGTELTLPGSTHFYLFYTVTYDGNGNTGGTVPVDPNSPCLAGSTVTVLGNTGNLVNTGYTFAGWNTASDGSGTPYQPGNTFTISENVTLYAQWVTLVISPASNTVYVGDTAQYKAYLHYPSGTPADTDVTAQCTWGVNDSSIAQTTANKGNTRDWTPARPASPPPTIPSS
jgi:uncharacterized repeat protein (TIGR02543 family)